MRRSPVLVMLALAVAACQSAEPRPPASAATVPTPMATSPSTPSPDPTPVPSSPFTGDGFEEWVIRSALSGFVEDLRLLYRDPDPRRLAERFTPDGLEAAKAIDWRLRESVHDGASFVGDVSMAGFSTELEDPGGHPPTFRSDVSVVIAPGSRLTDHGTGTVIETWPERQRFALGVTLEFDVDARWWVVTSVGPPTTGAFLEPAVSLPPPVRCPGLGPDQADSADLDESRIWCLGGRDGTTATEEQISIIDDYPCRQSHAAIVTIGWPVGKAIVWSERNQFVRDPDGRFHNQWPLPIPYRAKTTLPNDAYSTGLTDGEVEIWVSPSAGAKAIWAKRSSRVERWPHAPEEWGVIDCN